MMLYILLTLTLGITAGLVARWDGSKDGKGVVKAMIWGALFTLCASVVSTNPVFLIACFVMCSLGQAAPTGPGIDNGRGPNVNNRRIRWIDYILLLPLYNKVAGKWVPKVAISERTYDTFYNIIKSVLASSGIILAFMVVNVYAGFIMLLGAICAGFGYKLGHWIIPSYSNTKTYLGMNEATQLAEAFKGAVTGLITGTVLCLLLSGKIPL